jgi:hypothetical protein
MKYKYVCGIDPAPAKLGLSFLDVNTLEVTTFLFKSEEEKDFRFHAWLSRVGDIYDLLITNIENFLKSKQVETHEVLFVSEYPVPYNLSSPLMYALDYMIILQGLRNCELMLAHPNKIHMLMGRKSTKSEIKNFVLYLARENNLKFSTFTKSGDVKIQSDCADALLLVMWAFHNLIRKLNIPLELSLKWEDKFSVLSEKESLKMRGLVVMYVDN